jgi:peptide deformylase
MASLEILKYPDPRLREVAKAVEKVTDETRKLVEAMAETMYAASGCGLAATQVGIAARIFVIDIAGEDEVSDLRVFINPEILHTEGSQTWEEGCLSFPGAAEEIRRADRVRVKALDQYGKTFELEATGLMAIAIQHENDHLDGVLLIDKLNALRRRLVSRKVNRQLQEDAAAQS